MLHSISSCPLRPCRFRVARPDGQMKMSDVALATNDNSRHFSNAFRSYLLTPRLSLPCHHWLILAACLPPMTSVIILRGTSEGAYVGWRPLHQDCRGVFIDQTVECPVAYLGYLCTHPSSFEWNDSGNAVEPRHATGSTSPRCSQRRNRVQNDKIRYSHGESKKIGILLAVVLLLGSSCRRRRNVQLQIRLRRGDLHLRLASFLVAPNTAWESLLSSVGPRLGHLSLHYWVELTIVSLVRSVQGIYLARP